MRKEDMLQYLIQKGPGRTELELARAIHGDKAYSQSINTYCVMLVIEGKAERRGAGGAGRAVSVLADKFVEGGPAILSPSVGPMST
jgi:hypothetical protein